MIDVETLTLEGAATVSLGENGNTVASLAADTDGPLGSVTFINAEALSVGPLDATGPVDVRTTSGDLTLTGPIVTSDATGRAITLAAGTAAAAGETTGGNVVLDGEEPDDGWFATGESALARVFTGAFDDDLRGAGDQARLSRAFEEEPAEDLDPGVAVLFRAQEHTSTIPTPTIATITSGPGSLSVAFAPDGDGSFDALEYRLGDGEWVLADTTAPLSLTGLTPGVEQEVTLRYRDRGLPGPGSSGVGTPSSFPRPPEPEPEPEPEEEPVPEPVRTEEGSLPDSGEAVVEVGGARQEVTTTRTPSGGVEVSGDGFSIAVGPQLSGAAGDDGAGSGSGVGEPDGAAGPVDDGGSEEPGAGDGAVGTDVDLTFVRGRAAEVTVSGFRGSSPVQVWLFSDPQLLGEFTTSASGTLAAATDILGDEVSACRHTLYAEGELPSGQPVRLSLGVWVDADPYPFGDVGERNVHRRAVGCLADQQIVRGTAPGAYGPSGLTTRGQAASVFARWFGLEPSAGAVHGDVVGTTHADAVQALLEVGAVQGFDADTFGPDRVVTRGQFASMLAGVLGLPVVEASSFSDVGVAHAAAVGALEAAGVVSGFADGTFRPFEPITREQMASLVVRQQMALE